MAIQGDSLIFNNCNILNVETAFYKKQWKRNNQHMEITFTLYPFSQNDIDTLLNRYYKLNPEQELLKATARDTRTEVKVVITENDWFITLQTYEIYIPIIISLNDYDRENFERFINEWLKNNQYKFSLNDIIIYSRKRFEEYLNTKPCFAADFIFTLFEMSKAAHIIQKDNTETLKCKIHKINNQKFKVRRCYNEFCRVYKK